MVCRSIIARPAGTSTDRPRRSSGMPSGLCHERDSLAPHVAVYPTDLRIDCVTQPRRILGHHIQHRLNIRRRAGDHAQNLARRRLLLQRFGELAVASIELVEKPDVLDGDDSLAGECLKKLDLLVGKGRTSCGEGIAPRELPRAAVVSEVGSLTGTLLRSLASGNSVSTSAARS